MRVLLMAGCLALPGTLALAQACPVASDLEKGIRFTVDGTDTEVYRRVGPDMIEAIYSAADDYQSRSMLAQGVYLVELVDLVEGAPDLSTRTTYAFAQRAEELMMPEAGRSVTYDLVVNSDGDLNQERQSYSFDQPAKINFGACEYEMIQIEIRYDPDEAETVDLLYYLPELGFSYYAGSDYLEGSDRYIYSNIEVVE